MFKSVKLKIILMSTVQALNAPLLLCNYPVASLCVFPISTL